MKKSKWDILGSDIEKDNHDEYDDFFNYWYDGDYNNYDYYEHIDYGYLDDIYDEYVSKRGIRVSIDRRLRGNNIDMLSIYPKQISRQKKIDYLLGIDKWEILTKPTIGDIMKENKKDEDRDI